MEEIKEKILEEVAEKSCPEDPIEYEKLIENCKEQLDKMDSEATKKIDNAMAQLMSDMERDGKAMLTVNGISYCMEIWMRHFPEKKHMAYDVGDQMASAVSEKIAKILDEAKDKHASDIEVIIDNSYIKDATDKGQPLCEIHFATEVVWLQFVKKYGNAVSDIIGFINAADDEMTKVKEQIEEYEADLRELEKKNE